NVKQFRDYGANAPKMPRSRFTLESARQRLLVHECRTIAWINLLDRRPKQKIHTRIPAKFFVFIFRARIALVIAARLKLKRVHKNTDGDFTIWVGSLASNSNQLAVRLV